MPSGHYLKRLDRKRLLLAFCVFNRTAKQVFEEIYCGDTSQISYRRLRYLRNKLLRADFNEKIEYVTKRKLRRDFCTNHGPRRLLLPHHDILLAQIVEAHNELTDKQLAILLLRTIGATFPMISRNQIVDARIRQQLTYEKFTRINWLANVDEQISHYEDIAHIDPECMMNFDESYHGKARKIWNKCTGRVDFVQSRKNG